MTKQLVDMPTQTGPPSELPVVCMDDQVKAHRTTALARILTAPAILNQARGKIERRLAADPSDVNALHRLGDLQRKEGDLDAALETYRKLRLLQDGHMAAWRVGALSSDDPLTNIPDDMHPAPFVRVTDFLSTDRQDALLDAVRAGPEHFSPARVGKYEGVVNLEVCAAVEADGLVMRQVRPWFVEQLGGILPKVFRRFRVADMNEWYVELTVTAYQGGGFFRPHRDDVFRTRQVSFAYYFHREPKSFAGGELLLHDGCPATNRRQAASFSRIEPLRNSLVFFPSGYYHEVLPVQCDSDAFEDSRFTVNGWLHRASDWEAYRRRSEEREHERMPKPHMNRILGRTAPSPSSVVPAGKLRSALCHELA